MAMRGDFTLRFFREELGDIAGQLSKPGFLFKGDESSKKGFEIEGNPTGGYLLMQVYDVHKSRHSVRINGKNLPGSSEVQGQPNTWETWMEEIPSGFLKKGNNSIQFVRDTSVGDNFLIAAVAIHWRESD
ncbi:MAG: hypothetical protein F6J98_02250 [Moorea sp. SIO4G2]|nr:hypothetical protein [Moorena sp. SIO4G2]